MATTAKAIASIVLLLLAVFYALFAVANLRPTYPKLEAAASGIGAISLLAGATLVWRVPSLAAGVAALGTTVLVVWFAYDALGQTLFYLSMIPPIVAIIAVAILRSSRPSRQRRPGRWIELLVL